MSSNELENLRRVARVHFGAGVGVCEGEGNELVLMSGPELPAAQRATFTQRPEFQNGQFNGRPISYLAIGNGLTR